jgi:glycosyltransferase involved in cell wall biosynthesis
MAKTIWYFPLEEVKSRYTHQLCTSWIPDGIYKYLKINDDFRTIYGESISTDIKVGHVLDATGRGIYSLTQVANFLKEIRNGQVKSGDVLYIQDFWTPGIEAIQYALDLYKIKLKIYSMCHAQSVDEYDFTYQMKDWIRFIELGYDKLHKYGGIFVGSSIHKKQLIDAGFKSKIYVISLPFDSLEVKNRIKNYLMNIKNNIVFSSRLDTEKQPLFMLKIAKAFLKQYKDWTFTITTSGKTFKSNNNKILKKIYAYAKKEKRFILKENLSKNDYYKELCESKIQLNTSLQDYVSWTAIEASICQCDLCYPKFRSFPEFINKNRLYEPWDINSVLNILHNIITSPITHNYIFEKSNKGRLIACNIIVNGKQPKNINIWRDN